MVEIDFVGKENDTNTFRLGTPRMSQGHRPLNKIFRLGIPRMSDVLEMFNDASSLNQDISTWDTSSPATSHPPPKYHGDGKPDGTAETENTTADFCDTQSHSLTLLCIPDTLHFS
eukprot:scaffold25500_cov31-Attheya_sp.AAC.1